MMSGSQRLLAILLASAMLIGGFAFGRMTESPRTNAAGENPTTAAALQPAPAAGSSENQKFYLTDYKTGYSDGYNAGAKGVNTTAIQTDRTGYNDGYKEGYADAIQAKATPRAEPAAASASARPTMEYRSAPAPARRNGSTMKTALTIAAPAAIGAGIGAAAGGGRGAAAGALIGGGGGALYHLMKNRNRN